MHSLSLIHPIRLSGEKSRAGHSRFGYAANTILREVALTSENLQNWAILDSGASSHFLLLTAPVLNKMVADRPLTVKLPNGNTVRSSHIAELDLPLLPRGGREAHIVNWLASHSLVSVVKLCNAGCQVDVKDISCEIRYRGKTIVQCSKDVNTGLWMMPLTNGMEKPTYATQQNDKENVRPNENQTINTAAESTVTEWKKMQTKTTSKTGWTNYVHQFEKVPNKHYDSK